MPFALDRSRDTHERDSCPRCRGIRGATPMIVCPLSPVPGCNRRTGWSTPPALAVSVSRALLA